MMLRLHHRSQLALRERKRALLLAFAVSAQDLGRNLAVVQGHWRSTSETAEDRRKHRIRRYQDIRCAFLEKLNPKNGITRPTIVLARRR